MFPLFKHAFLSETTLRRTIDLLNQKERELLLKWHWESIPDDKEYTENEKLAFIIASTPRCGEYEAETLKLHCLDGPINYPEMINEKNHPYSRPALRSKLSKICPEKFHKMTRIMKMYKNVPEWIKENNIWMGLILIMNFIDSLYRKFKNEQQVNAILMSDSEILKHFGNTWN